jgi:hypothetical protein
MILNIMILKYYYHKYKIDTYLNITFYLYITSHSTIIKPQV